MTAPLHPSPDDAAREDRALVAAALAGDRGALARLVERARALPRAVAALNADAGRPLGAEDAADAADEAAQRLATELAGGGDDGALDARIARLAVEEFGRELRREGRASPPATGDPSALVARALAAGPVEHEDDVVETFVEAFRAARARPGAPFSASDARRSGPASAARTDGPHAPPRAPRHPTRGAWSAPGGPMLSWWWIAGGVTAVLVAVFAPRLFPPALVAPVGDVEGFATFQWREAPADGVVHEVRVWLDADSTGAPDLRAPGLAEPRWQPSPAERERLGAAADRIRWEVVAVDVASGSERRVGAATARRTR